MPLPVGSPRGRPLGASTRVALGIFGSRVLGLVRESVLAAVFGLGAHADVLATVFRGPNLLQNLLGEQTLSASFIPVYSRFLGEGRRRTAGRFAGAVLGLLLATAAALTLIGVVFARPMVALFAPGYLADGARVAAGLADVDRYELAVRAIRITFPMAAILVIAAWALGVLNSHRRFFLPYVAPALWNVVIITAVGAAVMVWLPGFGMAVAPALLDRILVATCVGALVGALVQFGVQLPLVARVLRGFRLSLSLKVEGVRTALRALGPVLAARGAVQLSAYFDQVLASLAAAGAPSGIRWASTLYFLPVSLFAVSVAAAELPELARRSGAEAGDELVARAVSALRQIAFLVLPTTLGFLVLGRLIVAAIYQRGSFTGQHSWLVYLTLAGYSLGLPAVCWSRAVINVFWARGDTRRPARIAGLRMAIAAAVGVVLMFRLDEVPVSLFAGPSPAPLALGATGLALATAAAVWVELVMLRRALASELPDFRMPLAAAGGMLARAAVAMVPAVLLEHLLSDLHRVPRTAVVVLGYAALYLWLSRRSAAAEIDAWAGRFGRRGGGRAGR